MVEVFICVGSVCHIHGAYDVVKVFETLIEKNKLATEVVMKACFCTGNCKKGVSVRVEETYIDGIDFNNAEEKFNEFILGSVKNGHNPV